MANGNGQAVPQAGGLARVDVLGGSEFSVSSDVQAAALAAQAEAEVKARWAIAQRNPRQFDSVRVKLLAECQRPGFAELAEYKKPVGDRTVTGPSIRFVEAALRYWGNIYAPATVISEDAAVRRMQVMVTDLETNVSWPKQISFRKTVERSSNKDRQVLSERMNSYGRKTYEVLATEDELLNKENALVSKAIRTAGLRLLPGDLVEEAMAACKSTRAKTDKADPQAAKKKLIDSFAQVGVAPEMLAEYVGHSLDAMQPAELEDLRGIYAAIRDGESKWADAMELKRTGEQVQAPPKTPPPAGAAPSSAAPAASTPAAATEDPITKEVEKLTAEIAATTNKAELQKLSTRIRALPDKERAELSEPYSKKMEGFLK